MRIGVFIGWFDPVHLSHIKIAQALTGQGILDKVVMVAASNNYDRKNLTKVDHRIHMLQLAFENNPKIEIVDAKFCMENVHHFMVMDAVKKKYPFDDIYLILGSDRIKKLQLWRGADNIMRNYKLIAVGRGNDNLEQLIGNSVFLKTYADKIYIFTIIVENISSTEVRTLVNKRKPIDGLTTKEVAEYIRKNRLFR